MQRCRVQRAECREQRAERVRAERAVTSFIALPMWVIAAQKMVIERARFGSPIQKRKGSTVM